MNILDRVTGIFNRGKSEPPVSDDVLFRWPFAYQAGVTVTPERVLQLNAVYACVSVLAKAIAASEFKVYKEDLRTGNRLFQLRSNYLYYVLNVAPNPEVCGYDLREAIIFAACLFGNAYCEVVRDRVGRVIELWMLDSRRMTLVRDANGRLIYRYRELNGSEIDFASNDIFHIHGPSLNALIGFETWSLAAKTMGHAIALEEFSAAFFANGARPSGAFQTEGNLTDDQRKELKRSVEQYNTGPKNAHKFLILMGGLKWAQFTTNPDDAQFIDTYYQTIENVCRWFGVPPHKIQHLLRATNNNIEHQGIEFVRDALTPWAERLRQESDKKLVARATNLHTWMDLEWLSEGDAKSKADADAIDIRSGKKTLNEVRRQRGLLAIPTDIGDVHWMQAQMVPVERLIEAPPPPAAPVDPVPNDDAPDDDDDDDAAGDDDENDESEGDPDDQGDDAQQGADEDGE